MESVELFTGTGDFALRFNHLVLVERDKWACSTLRENQLRDRPLPDDW